MHEWTNRRGVRVVSCVPRQRMTAWDYPATHAIMSWSLWLRNICKR